MPPVITFWNIVGEIFTLNVMSKKCQTEYLYNTLSCSQEQKGLNLHVQVYTYLAVSISSIFLVLATFTYVTVRYVSYNE